MMKILRNERGMALMMAMVITLISLAVVMALLYFITQGMQLSASSRRYKSALEASHGGVEVFTKEILQWYIEELGQNTVASRGLLIQNIGNLPNVFNGVAPTFSNYSCMTDKLNKIPSKWGTSSTHCGYNPLSGDLRVHDPTVNPDAIFKLRGTPDQPNFNVYAKIVDSLPGNSDMTGITGLDAGAGVAYGAAGVSPIHIPATYHIEVQAQRETNPQERAKISVLYTY